MAPEDDENLRIRNYLLTMAVRLVCIILCAVVVPYGWHTALFAVGAIALPYIAVVIANAASGRRVTTAENPTLAQLEAPPAAPEDDAPTVIRIAERPAPRPEDETS
ncbi:hypothetical protein A7J15_09200 [Microbacterium sediminis]|uniref:Uncharacterized protein n=2 Tax=Microbacterium sediminis TaxID=904291 RepID=A0A1B9N930_9MICO|nr:hypothetical protein A7J15_09200 [Microbacterium sediminis]QBR75477.1 DUF3099 domain-containing protein [Microbacterium sediminis]